MVSIKDVAKEAGVAISTVSKVLNNYPNVSEKTRKKVMDVVDQLGFVPNAMAASLSSKKTGRVALLIRLKLNTQASDEISMQYIGVSLLENGKTVASRNYNSQTNDGSWTEHHWPN